MVRIPEFDPKPEIWSETLNLIRNPKFDPKPEIWSETRNLIRNQKFDPKPEIWSETRSFIRNPKFNPKPEILNPLLESIKDLHMPAACAVDVDPETSSYSKTASSLELSVVGTAIGAAQGVSI